MMRSIGYKSDTTVLYTHVHYSTILQYYTTVLYYSTILQYYKAVLYYKYYVLCTILTVGVEKERRTKVGSWLPAKAAPIT